MSLDNSPIPSYRLTLALLERHPVWGAFEGDDSEMIRPVDSTEPFKVECDPLTIRADFTTPLGRSLKGAVVVDRADNCVYLVEIFVSGQCFGFNLSLHDLAEQQSVRLRSLLGSSDEPLFPLAFRTPIFGPNGRPYAGVFSLLS